MPLAPKSFQDIITFSRDTGNATYYNSSGYLTTAGVWNYLTYSNQPENAAWVKSASFIQTNLLTYSQEFNNAAWSKTATTCAGAEINATTAPDGTLTADKIVETIATSGHVISNSGTVGVTQNVASVYLKKGTGATAPDWIQLYTGGVSAQYANFNLATASVGNVAVGSTATITSVGDGWYRCTLNFTPGSAGSVTVAIAFTNNTDTTTRGPSYAGAITSDVFVWGAQLVQGAVPGDYRATTAAALPILYADYNGALRARKVCEDNVAAVQHRINQTTAFVGGSGTYFIKAKAGERQYASLRTNTAGAVFDLLTGAIALSGAAGTTASIQNLGSGWWLCVFNNTAAAVNEICRVNIENSFTVASSYTGDGSSGIYIADAQLNDGSSALSYYETTAFQYNAPRFDYDPVTLQPRGLLVEEQRTNLALQSSGMAVSPWAFTDTTPTANNIASPEGVVNATLFTEGSAGTAVVTQGSMTITAGATVTASMYLKRGNHDWVNILCTDAGAANGFKIWVNLATGVIGTTGVNGTGTYTSSAIQNAGNGWYRVSLTGITSAVNIAANIYCTSASADNSTTRVSGGTRYMYGAQLEANAFATSYIPTVASQVTRAADVARVNTLSPWFNQAGGTIYVQALHGAIPAAAALAVEIGDGTNDNRHAIFTAGTANASYYVFVSGVSQATIAASAFTANAVGKFAAAYAVNDFQTAGNGTLGSSDASGSLPINLTTLFIGNNIGSTSFWNGWILRITYYPRRLTNAELQAITT